MNKQIGGTRKALPGRSAWTQPTRSSRKQRNFRPAIALGLLAAVLALLWSMRPTTKLEAGQTYKLVHFQKNPVVKAPVFGKGIGYDLTVASRFHKPITVPVLRSSLNYTTKLWSKTIMPTSVAITSDGRIGIMTADWNPGMMLPDPNRRPPKNWGIKK